MVHHGHCGVLRCYARYAGGFWDTAGGATGHLLGHLHHRFGEIDVRECLCTDLRSNAPGRNILADLLR